MQTENIADTLDVGPSSPGRRPFASPRCRQGNVARITGHNQPLDGLYVQCTEIEFDRSFDTSEWIWRVRPLCRGRMGRAGRRATDAPTPLPWSSALCSDNVLMPVGRIRASLVMACAGARYVVMRAAYLIGGSHQAMGRDE